MSEYEPYRAPGAADEARFRGGGEQDWRVVLEYSNRGDAKPPTKLDVVEETYPSRDAALVAAEEQALTYFPPDPWNVQKRTVLADGPDGFLVVLEGLTSTYHFRSRAMRFVAEA
ncbi:MAG: hypothetical protein CMH83_08255 [Nocardioides sp.]|nr:hypothetical protein [Nocardioides sp.]